MKTVKIEQIGIVNVHWIVRGYKDSVLEYQYNFYDIVNEDHISQDLSEE